MTTNNTINSNHPLVIKCKNITDNFENEVSELVLEARKLPTHDQKKVISELKATVQNVNFILNSIFSAGDEEEKSS